jgi:hypothetical protein
MGTDRQSDADMYKFTTCESTKMNAESRTKQDQKKWVFFAALQHTHHMQKSTNMVIKMKKCRHVNLSGRKLCKY